MIFIGDSITAWNPRGNFLNRGVAGDTTRDLLERLEKDLLIRDNDIYLMIGINDILMGISEAKIMENIEKILDILLERGCKCNLLTILPIVEVGRRRNAIIDEINSELLNISKKREIRFIDVNKDFKDKEGKAIEYLYTDGIHLSTYGYDLLNKKI